MPGHCGIIGNERADILAKKGTPVLQAIDRPISFYTMKTLIRREFKTLSSNELKPQTREKQWTAALSNIAGWSRLEDVAEFGLHTRHDCLAKYLHRIGVYAQPTCPLCDLQKDMEKIHLIQCPALQTATESQRYWEARSQLMG
nr:hypothetical protein HmN_000752000 [Hymenolepis microstoma]